MRNGPHRAYAYIMMILLTVACDFPTSSKKVGNMNGNQGDGRFAESTPTSTVVSEPVQEEEQTDEVQAEPIDTTVIETQITQVEDRIDRTDANLYRIEKSRSDLITQRAKVEIDYAKAGLVAGEQYNPGAINNTRESLDQIMTGISNDIVTKDNELIETRNLIRTLEAERDALIGQLETATVALYQSNPSPKVIRQQIGVMNRQIARLDGAIARADDFRSGFINLRTQTEIELANTTLLEAPNSFVNGKPTGIHPAQKRFAIRELEESIVTQNVEIDSKVEEIRVLEASLRTSEQRLDELTLKLEKEPADEKSN